MSGHDPTDIVGQEARQERDAKRAKFLADQEVDDFKWVMSNKKGRRFVWRHLEKAGVFRSSFTGNSETFFREGSRNLGLQVLAMVMEHTPEAFALMLKEQKENERSNDQRTSDH